MSRREMLQLLAVGAALPAAAFLHPQLDTPQFRGLDHVEFYVSDPELSRNFFARIFGNSVLVRGAKRYLKLGSSYMAFEPPRGNAKAGGVDHVSLSIKSLEMSRLHAFLENASTTYQDYPSGRDTAILDPDGTRLQLSPEDGWTLLMPPNFVPETVPLFSAPVFRPLALHSALIQVTDIERSSAYYQKVLGSPVERGEKTAWFNVGTSRLGILSTSAGEATGVRFLAVSVSQTDMRATEQLLRQSNIQIESSSNDVLEFRDPDGLRFQVISA